MSNPRQKIELILALVVLAVVITGGYYLLKHYRPKADTTTPTGNIVGHLSGDIDFSNPVSVIVGPGMALTNSDGSFSIANIPAGIYHYTIQDDQYYYQDMSDFEATIEVLANDTVALDVANLTKIPIPPDDRTAPTVSSFTPASGFSGSKVTINGTNFYEDSLIKFGDAYSLDTTFVSATQLTAIVPPGASTGKITVSTNDKDGASATDFTVIVSTPTTRNTQRISDINALADALTKYSNSHNGAPSSSAGWVCISSACSGGYANIKADSAVDAALTAQNITTKPTDPADSTRGYNGYVYNSSWSMTGTSNPALNWTMEPDSSNSNICGAGSADTIAVPANASRVSCVLPIRYGQTTRNTTRSQAIQSLLTAFQTAGKTGSIPSTSGYICVSSACLGGWSIYKADANVDALLTAQNLAKPDDPTDSTRGISGYLYNSNFNQPSRGYNDIPIFDWLAEPDSSTSNPCGAGIGDVWSTNTNYVVCLAKINATVATPKQRNAQRVTDNVSLSNALSKAAIAAGAFPTGSGKYVCVSSTCGQGWSAYKADNTVDSMLSGQGIKTKPTDPINTTRGYSGYLYYASFNQPSKGFNNVPVLVWLAEPDSSDTNICAQSQGGTLWSTTATYTQCIMQIPGGSLITDRNNQRIQDINYLATLVQNSARSSGNFPSTNGSGTCVSYTCSGNWSSYPAPTAPLSSVINPNSRPTEPKDNNNRPQGGYAYAGINTNAALFYTLEPDPSNASADICSPGKTVTKYANTATLCTLVLKK